MTKHSEQTENEARMVGTVPIVSKCVFMQNLSYQNSFDLHEKKNLTEAKGKQEMAFSTMIVPGAWNNQQLNIIDNTVLHKA